MMINTFLLSKLHEVYIKHECIIIAVDFDDTILPSCKESEEQCQRTRDILQYVDTCINYKLIIYTARATDISNMTEIDMWCKKFGIKYHEINRNIIEYAPQPSKLYFNILLDDKSGLTECQNTLERFVDEILQK